MLETRCLLTPNSLASQVWFFLYTSSKQATCSVMSSSSSRTPNSGSHSRSASWSAMLLDGLVVIFVYLLIQQCLKAERHIRNLSELTRLSFFSAHQQHRPLTSVIAIDQSGCPGSVIRLELEQAAVFFPFDGSRLLLIRRDSLLGMMLDLCHQLFVDFWERRSKGL